MRPPEVFVRELRPEEGQRLKSISRRAKYQSKRERAMILLASQSWEELGLAMARHISYRNGPHRDRRLAELQQRRRVA